MIETIKKHKAPFIIAAALIIAAAAFIAGMAVKNSSADTTTDKFIGVDKALEIAFADAGVKKADASITDVEVKKDDGVSIYGIDFRTKKMKFSYEIDAMTGSILENEKEKLKNSSSEKGSDQNAGGSSSGGSASSYIGVAAAKRIALEHAGVSAGSAHFSSAHLDTEDGVKVYEVEFSTGSREYDFTINATTGEVLDYDTESLNYDENSGSSYDKDDDDDRYEKDDDRDDDDRYEKDDNDDDNRYEKDDDDDDDRYDD